MERYVTADGVRTGRKPTSLGRQSLMTEEQGELVSDVIRWSDRANDGKSRDGKSRLKLKLPTTHPVFKRPLAQSEFTTRGVGLLEFFSGAGGVLGTCIIHGCIERSLFFPWHSARSRKHTARSQRESKRAAALVFHPTIPGCGTADAKFRYRKVVFSRC